MPELFTAENLIAFLTLASLEIVLGIDNIVFLAITTSRLPLEQQPRARQVGLLLAMGMRIALLLGIKWIMGLEAELFSVFGHAFTGKGLILLGGGLFLIGKSTHEIHHKLEDHRDISAPQAVASSFAAAIVQVVLIDLVFSLDSVITAVGMAKEIWVMIAAIVVAVLVMMVFAGAISNFIEQHPTLKMLALAFLILIGVLLVADAFDAHVNRGYVYFAMGFSLAVELLNIQVRRRQQGRAANAAVED